MKIYIFILISIFSILQSCGTLNHQQDPIPKINQEEIIEQYLHQGAWKHHYLTKEWGDWINKGIQKDSTIAYLWQQKALPFWKTQKYSQAILYYNKAVELDPQKWLSRLGFLKCIYAKDYHAALKDLVSYKNEFGSTYEQDHALEFYVGLCYLQINQFEQALSTLEDMIAKQESEYGTNWVHYLDRFYLGITYFELGDYEKAILKFSKVLVEYPKFSDAQFYKAICLNELGQKAEARELLTKGKSNFKIGYTINEGSSTYVDYPYQVTWQWDVTESIIR